MDVMNSEIRNIPAEVFLKPQFITMGNNPMIYVCFENLSVSESIFMQFYH